MTDVRQSVSPAAGDVLDQLDLLPELYPMLTTAALLLDSARARVCSAHNPKLRLRLADVRTLAVECAAFCIAAVRIIDEGEDASG